MNYYKVFDWFLTIVILLESVINNCLFFDEVADKELINFLNEKCSDCNSFEDLTEMISKTEIKHPQNSKISKFTLKLYAFVYSWLIDFPVSNISFETIATTNIFENVNRIIKVKIHTHHHCHITDQIISYVNDFYNLRLRENKTESVCFAHNVFNFDKFFFYTRF